MTQIIVVGYIYNKYAEVFWSIPLPFYLPQKHSNINNQEILKVLTEDYKNERNARAIRLLIFYCHISFKIIII
jgi:hypothetical protein